MKSPEATEHIHQPTDDQERARVHRRTLTVVIASQILGGAGLAAGISVGGLLAQDMLGSDALTGVPTGLFTLGSALAAYLVGRSTQAFGRRMGLAYGFIAGGLGALGVVLFVFLRPDPYLLARRIAKAEATSSDNSSYATTAERRVPPVGIGAYVGAATMVLTQVVMVAVMTMTPIHMRAHDHDMRAVGLVIGLHIAAMWLPSLVTGLAVDRFGRTPMVIAAGVTLLLAGLFGAVAPGDSLSGLIVALVLLGLGWNFGLVAGTALVVDATVPENRPKTQGSIDVLIALAGAGGGAMSGVVMHSSSYQTLALTGGVIALAIIPVLLWARRRSR